MWFKKKNQTYEPRKVRILKQAIQDAWDAIDYIPVQLVQYNSKPQYIKEDWSHIIFDADNAFDPVVASQNTGLSNKVYLIIKPNEIVFWHKHGEDYSGRPSTFKFQTLSQYIKFATENIVSNVADMAVRGVATLETTIAKRQKDREDFLSSDRLKELDEQFQQAENN